MMVAVAVVAAAGLSLALRGRDDERDAKRILNVGESVTDGPLTLTLVESQFSEISTLLTFDMRLESVTERGDLPPVLLAARQVHVKGVEPFRPPAVSYQRPALDTVRHYVEVGPPIDQNQPVTITIQSVDTFVGGRSTILYGPWTFEVTAASVGPDPLGRTIEVGRTIDDGEIAVTVHKARISSDEVLVFYNLSTSKEFLGPPSAPARMFFKDGSFAPGLPLQGDAAARGELVVSFPKLPAEASEFELRFGPYLRKYFGERKIVIPLPASRLDTKSPVDVALDEHVPLEGENFVVQRLRVDDVGFTVYVAAESGVSSRFAATDQAKVVATDDLGNAYKPVAGELGFGKNESGDVFFRDAALTFVGPLDPGATSLTISVSNLASFERGPWDFAVKLD